MSLEMLVWVWGLTLYLNVCFFPFEFWFVSWPDYVLMYCLFGFE